MLSVIMLKVIMMSIIMVIVVAPSVITASNFNKLAKLKIELDVKIQPVT